MKYDCGHSNNGYKILLSVSYPFRCVFNSNPREVIIVAVQILCTILLMCSFRCVFNSNQHGTYL